MSDTQWSPGPSAWHSREEQRLRHFIKGTALEHWQAWGIHLLSGKPVQCSATSWQRKASQSPLWTPAVWLWTIPTCPVPGSQGEELSTTFSTSPPQEALRAMSPPRLNLLLSTPDKPRALRDSSQETPSSLFTSFDPLLWIMPSQILFWATCRGVKACVQTVLLRITLFFIYCYFY